MVLDETHLQEGPLDSKGILLLFYATMHTNKHYEDPIFSILNLKDVAICFDFCSVRPIFRFMTTPPTKSMNQS